MKNAKVHILVIIALLAAVVTVISFAARGSGDQRSTQKSKSPVKEAIRVTERPTVSPVFTAAAAKNAELRNELSWSFGGKQQRGWYLYDLLIGKTLNSEHEPVSDVFTSALAKWQKKTGLSPSGVLDQDSLMRMVSQWQSNRLKNRGYADPSD